MTKFFFVLALAGCLDLESKSADIAPVEPDSTGVADFAPFEPDCASDLDTCYKTCQAQQPSPTAQCFRRCDLVFYRCIPLD
jgi:hypothetical protein